MMEEFVHQTFVGKVIYTVMVEFVHQTFVGKVIYTVMVALYW